MPAMLSEDMKAINRYFMEQAQIKTPAAEKVKQEWMKFWKETERTLTWYSQDEYDAARNLKHKFDLANTTNAAEKASVKEQQAKGITSEEMRGETRRAGTSGDYLEDPKPLIPTSWKVGAVAGIGLVAVGVFGKKLLGMTPLGKIAKFLP